MGKKVGEKVGEKTGEKVGESLGEIDKLNLCPLFSLNLDEHNKGHQSHNQQSDETSKSMLLYFLVIKRMK